MSVGYIALEWINEIPLHCNALADFINPWVMRHEILLMSLMNFVYKEIENYFERTNDNAVQNWQFLDWIFFDDLSHCQFCINEWVGDKFYNFNLRLLSARVSWVRSGEGVAVWRVAGTWWHVEYISNVLFVNKQSNFIVLDQFRMKKRKGCLMSLKKFKDSDLFTEPRVKYINHHLESFGKHLCCWIPGNCWGELWIISL